MRLWMFERRIQLLYQCEYNEPNRKPSDVSSSGGTVLVPNLLDADDSILLKVESRD
jgi:hypothetical protein